MPTQKQNDILGQKLAYISKTYDLLRMKTTVKKIKPLLERLEYESANLLSCRTESYRDSHGMVLDKNPEWFQDQANLDKIREVYHLLQTSHIPVDHTTTPIVKKITDKMESEFRKMGESIDLSSDAKRKADEAAKRKADEAAKRKADEAAKRKADEEQQRKAAEAAKRKAEEAQRKAEEAQRKAEEAQRRAEEAQRKTEQAQHKAKAATKSTEVKQKLNFKRQNR